MWTRAELKERAKDVLRRHYWKAFLVSLLLAIVDGGSGSGGGRVNWRMNGPHSGDYGFVETAWPFIIIGLFAAVVVLVIAFAFKFFLANPLEVGGRKFFIQTREDNTDLNAIGLVFNRKHYLNVVKTLFFRDLFIFLWTLLLVVPGIIKYYAYRFVPYIVAENPEIDRERALELSSEMAYGEKWRMFVLDLSFIGWFILGGLLFGVGALFVLPYFNATYAELYAVIKDNAIREGICSSDEFGQSQPEM